MKGTASLPIGRHNRLTVVVGIKDDSAIRAGRCARTENDWRGAGGLQQLRTNISFFQRGDEKRRVPANIFVVGRDVRDGEQVVEFSENLRLVGRVPATDGVEGTLRGQAEG